MSAAKVVQFGTAAGATLPSPEAGALPDAPLAMPKQRLEPEAPAVFGALAGWLRPLFARAGRSRG